MERNEIIKIYGTDYKNMTKRLLSAAGLISRIPSANAMVGIKPNLVSPTPAEFGATTHPEIVAGIIEYLQENGHEKIMMLEGSWVGDRTSDAYEYCGFRALSEKYGVPFTDTQKDGYHEKDCAGMMLNICNAVEKVDFLINVPVIKGHCQTKVTCALKNMKGLIPNTEKRKFHTMGLHKPIAHLSQGIRQDFIVVDHICGDLDFEDGGNPVVRNCIMATLDPVLTDSYACRLIGYNVEDVPYIGLAEQLGTGCADLEKAFVTELDETGNLIKNTAVNDISAGDVPREHKILKISYAVNDADSCSACYANLAPALYRLQREGLLEGFCDQIAIGQGHKGRTGKIGIGNCTKDFSVCIKGCPPDEEKIYNELKSYLSGQRKKP